MSLKIETGRLYWVAALCLGAVLIISLIPWTTLLASIATLQKQLHVMLTEHISQVKNSPWQYGSALIVVSFLYGIFHAVGPGHGKAIIISYLGTQSREQMSHGVKLSMLAALLQALVAIALVTVTTQLLDLSIGSARKYGHHLELASYFLIIFLGGLICLRALWNMRALRLSESTHLHPDLASGNDHACHCQHHYVPDETVHDQKQRGLVVLSMGLRPCTGAVLVLMYAYVVNVYVFGVIATLAMGVGTGLAVALLAVMTVLCRTRLLAWMARRHNKGHTLIRFFSTGLMLFGGSLLLLLGIMLLIATDVVPVSHPLL